MIKTKQNETARRRVPARSAKTYIKNKAIVRQPSCEEISQKAYDLFQQRNYAHGNDQADWFEAEKQLSGTR